MSWDITIINSSFYQSSHIKSFHGILHNSTGCHHDVKALLALSGASLHSHQWPGIVKDRPRVNSFLFYSVCLNHKERTTYHVKSLTHVEHSVHTPCKTNTFQSLLAAIGVMSHKISLVTSCVRLKPCPTHTCLIMSQREEGFFPLLAGRQAGGEVQGHARNMSVWHHLNTDQ